MADDPGALSQLRDLALPDPVSWWPPAAGVWILAATVAGLALVFLTRAVMRRRADAYRRAAAAELDAIGEELTGRNTARRDVLLLLPALALWEIQSRASDAVERWRNVIDPALLRHLMIGGRTATGATPNALLAVGWILGVVAVAGPTWTREPSPFADARPPVVAVPKVTPPMQEADLAPTRLDRPRQKLSDLITLREGAETGLVAFRARAARRSSSASVRILSLRPFQDRSLSQMLQK